MRKKIVVLAREAYFQNGDDAAARFDDCGTSSQNAFAKAASEWVKSRDRMKDNKIRTTKYTILSFLPKNLFEQFHRLANIYFLILIGINFVPQANSIAKEVSMFPLIIVLTMQAVKDIIEDYGRHKSDKRINNSQTLRYSR